jgi:hypothetical protein
MAIMYELKHTEDFEGAYILIGTKSTDGILEYIGYNGNEGYGGISS